MKVLSEAKSRGIEILRIDGSNASLIDSLRVSNSVKVDLRNAVSVGKVVIIPEEEIGYYDWYGTGYIVMDPDSGAAGYMISGNLAGGVYVKCSLFKLTEYQIRISQFPIRLIPYNEYPYTHLPIICLLNKLIVF